MGVFTRNIEKKSKHSNSKSQEPSRATRGSHHYYEVDLHAMRGDFKSFARRHGIDYEFAKEAGLDTCLAFLERYYNDEIDGNMTPEECDMLYSLIEDPWDCSRLQRHRVLARVASQVAREGRSRINDVLILGAGIGGEYKALARLFPTARYTVTDVSTKALASFRRRFQSRSVHDIARLDVFSIEALQQFTGDHGEGFDLIVASGLFRYAPDRSSRRRSASHVYSHLLRPGGLFLVAEVRQDPAHDDPRLLSRTTAFNESFRTSTRKNPTQVVVYRRGRDGRAGGVDQ